MNIRKERQAKGWTQEQLSHESGIDRSYLSEVECGAKNIGITRLDAIAQALEVDIRVFFEGYPS